MGTARYLVGDVRQRLTDLEDDSVDLVMTSSPYTYRWREWAGIFETCLIGAHAACRGWTFYTCPRQPTNHCQCECHHSSS